MTAKGVGLEEENGGHSRWNSMSEGTEAGCIRCIQNDLPGE